MYSREPGAARAELGPTGMRQAKGGAEERGLKGSWSGHSDLGSPAAQAGGGRAKTGPCSPPHLCTRLFFLPFLPEVGKPPGLPQLPFTSGLRPESLDPVASTQGKDTAG